MLLILEKKKAACFKAEKAVEYHLAFPDPLPSPPGKEKQAGAWQAMQTSGRTAQPGQP